MRLTRIILLLIIILSIMLRFWKLSEIPPSLSWDEVAIGYNAWSVLETGRDEYGARFPILFRSFDDYKLPGMIYSAAISESFFGLNEWGVRLPSAIFGVFIVFIGYLLGKELLDNNFALLFSGLLAINPWLVNFSRQAFESNGATFFALLGVYFLILSKKKFKFIILSAIVFALTFYFYYSARVVIPIILASYIVIMQKKIRKNLMVTILAISVGLLLVSPLLPQIFSYEGFSRISQVVVTNDPIYVQKQSNFAKKILEKNNKLWARFVYNRRRAIAETIFANYIKNIKPPYIFKNGTISAGLLYPWEFPFVLIGLYQLLKQKKSWKWIFLAWLVSYPLTGALTRNQPNPLRTLIGAPVLIFVSSLGIYFFWCFLRKKNLQYYASLGIGLLFVFSFLWFFPNYINSSKTRAKDFGDGYKQLANYIQQHQTDYDRIWITGEYWRPYIHLLFHLKYPPSEYQKAGSRDGFGKYRFGAALWDSSGVNLGDADLKNLQKGKTLFILSEKEYKRQLSRHNFYKAKLIIGGNYADKLFWIIKF